MIKIVDGGVQYPVVVLVLLHIPLAVAVPVLVDERFLLACGCARPEELIDLRIGLIAHHGRAGEGRCAAHLQRAVELRVATIADGSHRGFTRAARAHHHAAGARIGRSIQHNRARPEVDS